MDPMSSQPFQNDKFIQPSTELHKTVKHPTKAKARPVKSFKNTKTKANVHHAKHITPVKPKPYDMMKDKLNQQP